MWFGGRGGLGWGGGRQGSKHFFFVTKKQKTFVRFQGVAVKRRSVWCRVAAASRACLGPAGFARLRGRRSSAVVAGASGQGRRAAQQSRQGLQFGERRRHGRRLRRGSDGVSRTRCGATSDPEHDDEHSGATWCRDGHARETMTLAPQSRSKRQHPEADAAHRSGRPDRGQRDRTVTSFTIGRTYLLVGGPGDRR